MWDQTVSDSDHCLSFYFGFAYVWINQALDNSTFHEIKQTM